VSDPKDLPAPVGAPRSRPPGLEVVFDPTRSRSDDHSSPAHPEEPERLSLALEVAPQPDDTTCGPTCLHAVYRYFGDEIDLSEVISSVTPLPGGGTLAVWLANHALRRGYKATIYTYNLQVFDPTWFSGTADVSDRLRAQSFAKSEEKLGHATEPYLEFLSMGGRLRLGEKTSTLIRRYLKRGIPILTGLSATYLYGCARETNIDYDDVQGEPLGHFVVLSGYDKDTREVMVSDPLKDNPGFGLQNYNVSLERLITSIMLGIVTYDANLLVLEPRPGRQRT
jgi:hypothetical protein